jgi:Fe-S cluster assembly protein SufD
MTQLIDRAVGTEPYLAEFDRARPGGPAWLQELRARAMSRFADLGFPTTREEEWRFTSVAPIVQRAFRPAPAGTAGVAAADLASAVSGESGGRLVFVNGRYAPGLSAVGGLPAGVEVGDLGAALASRPGVVEPHLTRLAGFDQAFTALNTALFEGGALVVVPAGVVVEPPLHLLFVSAPAGGLTVSHPRVLVVAGENSQVCIVESYAGVGDGEYFTNAVTEVVAGANAVVDHYKVQREQAGGFHVGSLHVELARSANVTTCSIALGAAFARNDIVAVLGGEGAECTLNGLYLVDGTRLVDTHTTIDHAQPHCDSHEVYKIIVRPDAQKTDAKQTNRALLLSDDAQINTKPQLEIFADDVKCTHGAAIGQLDEDAIFYLRSRGLDLDQARTILIQAFAGDILGRIRVEPLRERLEAEMLKQLPGNGTV